MALVVGVGQTLRRWTSYIRQGGHHVGHWPTFLVKYIFISPTGAVAKYCCEYIRDYSIALAFTHCKWDQSGRGDGMHSAGEVWLQLPCFICYMLQSLPSVLWHCMLTEDCYSVLGGGQALPTERKASPIGGCWTHKIAGWHATVAYYCIIWGVFRLLYVFCLFVRLRISQRRKKIGAWNFARMFDCYPSRQVFSHFGELWLAGSHSSSITSGMSYIRIAPGKKCLHRNHTWEKNFVAKLVGRLELAVAWWGSQNWGRRHRVRPYGCICVLQACWRTCLRFSVQVCHHSSCWTFVMSAAGVRQQMYRKNVFSFMRQFMNEGRMRSRVSVSRA